MYCKKCGKKIEKEDLYCPYCGCKNEFVGSSKYKSFLFFQENKKAIIILGSFLTVALIVIFYNLYQEYQEDRFWKEYKISQAREEQGYTSNGIDFSSLHKYENSTYKIGDTMPEGEYVLFATSGMGYFKVSSDSSGDSIICNDNFEYNAIVKVNKGEYLELSRCYAEPINSARNVSTTGSGTFKVGTHLKAGEYKLESVGYSSGYYCVYGDNRQQNIINNDNFEGTAYVTVREGQYLLLSRCKITN